MGKSSTVDSSQMLFPVLRFFRQCFVMMRNNEKMCAPWTMKAVRSKRYVESLYVDANLTTYRISSVEVLAGYDPMWGYNIGFNRTVRVRLQMTRELSGITLDQVKDMMRASFRDWEGWASDRSYSPMRRAVRECTTMSELLARAEKFMR